MTDGIIIFIYANPDNYLAGARFSCISQVSLVCTNSVGIVRNFPPQIITWVKPYQFSLFKYSVYGTSGSKISPPCIVGALAGFI